MGPCLGLPNMTKCTHCRRRAQLFLCNTCISELRDMLTGLAVGQPLPNGRRDAGFLAWLSDAALGKTKLNEQARRTPRYLNRLDGEASLASQIESFPDEREADLAKARTQRQKAALQHALGVARINLRAAELLDYAHSILAEWVRDICEVRKVECPTGDAPTLALWLARHVTAIASDDGADVCLREIRELVDDIERVINRPRPPRVLGPCPEQVDSGHTRGCDKAHPHVCATQLTARQGMSEITCPHCRTVHNCDALIERQIRQTDDYLFTMSELVNTVLPAVRECVPARTLRDWYFRGRLQPRDFTRDGEPKFLLADVRRLREQKKQKAATGGQAHRRTTR